MVKSLRIKKKGGIGDESKTSECSKNWIDFCAGHNAITSRGVWV